MTSLPSPPTAAVIDIGSNSIKLLVARRLPNRTLHAVGTRTIDARISAGISRAAPLLAPEGMARGLEAVRALLTEAAPFRPDSLQLVATSAVRDARNGGDFCALIRRETGHEVRILSGEEEANLIGRGLTCDPALAALRTFYVFDLGGGSMECLAFHERRIQQAVSLPLGCVRLTERFVPDANAPIPETVLNAIRDHARATILGSSFRFSLPSCPDAVATGGTATTMRAIRAARAAVPFEATDATLGIGELDILTKHMAAMPLAERKKVPGLPPARADVFPTALATLMEVASAGGLTRFVNSVYNLRYGLADLALP